MHRIIFVFCLFILTIFAQQDLKIIHIVPFGDQNIKITFNQKISSKILNHKKISSSSSVIDIQTILSIKRKRYVFPDQTSVQIAQQTKKITRIWIRAPKKLNYRFRVSDKFLYLEFGSGQKSKKKKLGIIKPQSQVVRKKRIVVDAGHGGKDCGAIGVLKVCEKIVTLGIAKLLKDELQKRGYDVYMTRSNDRYLGLRERTNFANNKSADLFISIHANSVPKRSAKTANGIETYFLSTARSERARRVAEKENQDSIEVMNFFSKKTFLNSINTHRLIASNKLAIDIQGGILNALRPKYAGILDGGVREGPFWVLAGALMPSVLIEVGYISHPQEGRRITHRDYQQALVKGIADGIGGYFEKNP